MSQLDNLNASQQAHAKMISEWRASLVKEHTLPSGLVIKIRDLDVISMAFNGDIPNTMFGMVEEVKASGGKIETHDLDKFGDLINRLALACVIDPPLALEPDELHIGVKELSGADRIDIFMYANREVGNLQTFRSIPDQPVDAVQPGQDLQPPTEPAPGA